MGTSKNESEKHTSQACSIEPRLRLMHTLANRNAAFGIIDADAVNSRAAFGDGADNGLFGVDED